MSLFSNYETEAFYRARKFTRCVQKRNEAIVIHFYEPLCESPLKKTTDFLVFWMGRIFWEAKNFLEKNIVVDFLSLKNDFFALKKI